MANRKYTQRVKTKSGYDVFYPKTVAEQVIPDKNHQFVTEDEKAEWNAKANTSADIAVATPTSDGLMSKEDKTKLDDLTTARLTIPSVPSQNGTLTYNGSTQTPIWANYNSAILTIGGVTSSANAGTYTATFAPKSNYEWADGSTTAKSVTWIISKAAGGLSISPETLTIDASNLTRSITINRVGDGAISVVSSNTNVADRKSTRLNSSH